MPPGKAEFIHKWSLIPHKHICPSVISLKRTAIQPCVVCHLLQISLAKYQTDFSPKNSVDLNANLSGFSLPQCLLPRLMLLHCKRQHRFLLSHLPASHKCHALLWKASAGPPQLWVGALALGGIGAGEKLGYQKLDPK